MLPRCIAVIPKEEVTEIQGYKDDASQMCCSDFELSLFFLTMILPNKLQLSLSIIIHTLCRGIFTVRDK